MERHGSSAWFATASTGGRLGWRELTVVFDGVCAAVDYIHQGGGSSGGGSRGGGGGVVNVAVAVVADEEEEEEDNLTIGPVFFQSDVSLSTSHAPMVAPHCPRRHLRHQYLHRRMRSWKARYTYIHIYT